MSNVSTFYAVLANGVLILHIGTVLFIVAGLVLTLAGGALGWRWVRNVWFRSAHLAAIVVVAMEAWAGIVCPLTTLEQWLRLQAGEAAYSGDFIAHWLGRLLYYQAEPWVFILLYSAFGLLVAASWYLVRPGSLTRDRPRSARGG